MKKWILILMCLFPIAAWAECENPAGSTFQTMACGGDQMTVEFYASGYSPIDCCNAGYAIVTVKGADYIYPYAWDGTACCATIKADSEFYLIINGNSVTVSALPAFGLAE